MHCRMTFTPAIVADTLTLTLTSAIIVTDRTTFISVVVTDIFANYSFMLFQCNQNNTNK